VDADGRPKGGGCMLSSKQSKSSRFFFSWDQLQHASTRYIYICSLVVAAFLLLIAATLDFLVAQADIPFGVMIICDCLFASFCGLLVFKILSAERERQQLLARRLMMIAEMNHHVRNAMEAITLSVHATRDQNLIASINSSLNRIQWTLREILPEPQSGEEDKEKRSNVLQLLFSRLFG
jgi:hypothetical protein